MNPSKSMHKELLKAHQTLKVTDNYCYQSILEVLSGDLKELSDNIYQITLKMPILGDVPQFFYLFFKLISCLIS